MPTSRSLTRMPVYDVSNGRIVGRVHRLIVDADVRKVIGLLLATRLGKEARCLPFRNIHSIGEHAVTVRGMDAITRLSDLPDMEEVLRSQRRIYHSPILTEDGSFVGDVDEFTVNAQTGRIDTLLISGGLIHDLFRGQVALPAHLVVTIGEDATIVRDQAVTMLKQRRREQMAAGAEATGTDGRRAAGAGSAEQGDNVSAHPQSNGAEPEPRPSLGQRLRNTFVRRRRGAVDADTPLTVIDAREDRIGTSESATSHRASWSRETSRTAGTADASVTDETAGGGGSEEVTGIADVIGSSGTTGATGTAGIAGGTDASGGVGALREFGQEAGFEQHVVENGDDIVPPVPRDGREGSDGKP